MPEPRLEGPRIVACISQRVTERIAGFDDYQSCVSAGQTLYPDQHWECVPQDHSQGRTGR